MGGLQPIHWVIVGVAVLVLFGGKKIPELMRGLGQGMGEFKKGHEESKRTIEAMKSDDEKKSDEKETADKK